MSVKVLFFASLRERLGKAQMDVVIQHPASVADIWQLATGEQVLPARILVSINQVYANAESEVKIGDEVAFFPPVTGG